jgi:tryptophan synthase beta chain
MVRVSYNQKPYRRLMMEVWGAECFPSPSDRTAAGRKILAQDSDSPGSLGIAISEAVEDAMSRDDTRYSLGSVLNHVLLHQTIVGLETKKQLEMAGDYPDVVIGCVGGGSNFGGFSFPFVADRLAGNKVRALAVEPTACPTLTKGQYRYDFGDTVGLAPMVRMYTLGHTFIPPGIHAGGLRYHGDSPLLSLLVHEGYMEAVAYHQNPVFEAAMTFARTEGIIPAPETAHAIKAVFDEALAAKEAGEKRVIAFNLSGHGHFDLAAYDDYLTGKLVDYELPQEQIDAALAELPTV